MWPIGSAYLTRNQNGHSDTSVCTVQRQCKLKKEMKEAWDRVFGEKNAAIICKNNFFCEIEFKVK